MSKQNTENNILDRPGHPDGMTVPNGYFEAFARDMMASLPPNELEQQPAQVLTPPTTWQRIRPFMYMAAMFAGIWCMMKMFSMIHNAESNSIFGNNPTVAEAISNDDFVYDFVNDDYNQEDILEELYADGFNTNDFNF